MRLANRDELIVLENDMHLIGNQNSPVHEFGQMKLFVY